MGNPLVHFEFAGRNGENLKAFYTKLFGWDTQRVEAGGYPYDYVDTGANPGMTGGIRHEPEGKAEIVLYFMVGDVIAAVERAEQLGAKVRIPPVSLGDKTFALVEDPEGNPVGIILGKEEKGHGRRALAPGRRTENP